MTQRLCLLGIVVGAALLALVPSAQSSTPTCFGKPATIVGTNGDDPINGTNEDDVIVTLDGDDTVGAKAGNDLVCTGNGSDHVSGSSGNDRINLGPSDCGVEQGADADDPSLFDSGGGNDIVYDGANCNGGPQDFLEGDSGDDQLFGKGGPDLIVGDSGSDKMYGGTGNDGIEGRDGEHDLLSGGKGKDVCTADPSGDTVKGCP